MQLIYFDFDFGLWLNLSFGDQETERGEDKKKKKPQEDQQLFNAAQKRNQNQANKIEIFFIYFLKHKQIKKQKKTGKTWLKVATYIFF